ncbi:MAG: ribosome silencing factor [Bacteroidales bacterium]|nr:ribosome silencing factor [Bacteroidales bacterium]
MAKKKKKELSSQKLAELIVESLLQKKGIDVISINFKGMSNAITDYFIICHGSSTTHVEALADNVYDNVKKESGEKPWHVEGKSNAEWVLLDYINVVVHVFLDSAREFYKIEKLWADAEVVKYDE